MKFTVFYVLYAFCVFYAEADSITDLKTVVDETAKTIVDYEQQFFNSIIVLVSNLKDTSTETLGESWNATILLSEILNEKTKTKEEKDCIASESNKLGDIINSVAFTLDGCRENSAANGQPLRKKIQDVHKATMDVEKDLDTVRSSCSHETDKSKDDCISSKVNDLQVSLKDILDQMQTYMIEAGTIKPQILSNAMYCNAKILKDIHESVTNIQKSLHKCI